ncbi:hypothetical protein RhiirA1_472948 [Rhizophagus irregularis]|uniref:ubiquitinyl hydrolase 1 n=1 Tax=Rhizophagus irregularis TaxID=588596 RepID=A0A2N0R1F7_9GLOM|nr:hypothetical protein RhiirA1_472948 [Rhizophagus irregularis]
MTSCQNEMKLYMEIAEKPINGKSWCAFIMSLIIIIYYLSDFLLLNSKLILQIISVDMVSRETLSCDGVPQVAGAVATRLNDPFKLRFTIEHLASGTPKNMLETSIVLEAKKFFKVYWLANTVKKRKVIDIRLQKYTIISKHIEEISNKVTLSSPNSRIMLFKVYHNKIQKEYNNDDTKNMRNYMQRLNIYNMN